MEHKTNLPKEITLVTDRIINLLRPSKIYLFSNKRGEMGRTAGFKLCVILEHDDRAAAERDIYLNVESEVPFDVVVYSPKEWQALCLRKGSFAQKVAGTGVLIYE